MARCTICDHVDGIGNTYLDKYNIGNRVRWNNKTNEWVCSECRSHINNTVNEEELASYDSDLSQWFPTNRDKQGY